MKAGGKDKQAVALQHELMSTHLWEQVKTSHYEACKEDASVTGSLPIGFTIESLDDLLTQQNLTVDKAVLKLLQEACRVGRSAVAIDYGFRLRTEKALQAAIMVANNLGRPNVAQIFEEILQQKIMVEQERQLRMNAVMTVGYEGNTGNESNQGGEVNYPPLGPSYNRYDGGDNGDDDGEGEVEIVDDLSPEARYERGESGRIDRDGDGQSGSGVGVLSRQVSVREEAFNGGQNRQSMSSNNNNLKKVVLFDEDDDNDQSPERTGNGVSVKAINPFAKNGNGFASPLAQKRKTAAQSLKDMKGSPSPNSKKPMLSVSLLG